MDNRILRNFVNHLFGVSSYQGVYSMEKHGKVRTNRNFFCTRKNQGNLTEFYWNSAS